MKSRTSVGMRKKERKSGSPIVGLPLQSVEKAQHLLDFFDRLKRGRLPSFFLCIFAYSLFYSVNPFCRVVWCRGYYVDTVGKNAKKIEEYIKLNKIKFLFKRGERTDEFRTAMSAMTVFSMAVVIL